MYKVVGFLPSFFILINYHTNYFSELKLIKNFQSHFMESSVRNKYKEFNQEQVFQFWDKISTTEQESLLKQLDSIDLKSLEINFKNAIKVYQEKQENQITALEEFDNVIFIFSKILA